MTHNAEEKLTHIDRMHMTADVVSAYLSNNVVPSNQIAEIIKSVFGTLNHLEEEAEEKKEENLKPAVPVRRSITPEFIVCLEDGKKLKMLKRHLRTTYNMTPQEYKEKWNLPMDYPMVAPNYAKQRSSFAKQIGLGKKSGNASPTRRGRKKKAA